MLIIANFARPFSATQFGYFPKLTARKFTTACNSPALGRPGTRLYEPYIKRWTDFCDQRETNPFDPSVTLVLDFLAELHENGLPYTTLNTAQRSAIYLSIHNTERQLHYWKPSVWYTVYERDLQKYTTHTSLYDNLGCSISSDIPFLISYGRRSTTETSDT